MKEFILSDLHLLHKNIIKHCADTRRGADHLEMTDLLIDAWNSRVGPQDRGWLVGDFSFGKTEQTLALLQRMNGIKCLIVGNHDAEQKWIKDEACRAQFEMIKDRFNLKYGGLTFVLDHYPIQEWRNKHRGWCHLHGHSHGYTDSWNMRRFDVGVDARPDNKMEPWDMDEIVEIMNRRPVETKREHSDGRSKPTVQW